MERHKERINSNDAQIPKLINSFFRRNVATFPGILINTIDFYLKEKNVGKFSPSVMWDEVIKTHSASRTTLIFLNVVYNYTINFPLLLINIV